ncbi:ribonuclease domain-containing protein [Xanthomonas sp. CFBP 8445]|uniref:ribonuclease domain-containing protein n=1 Tax=Xanthomonas sp. CFBP 8445 TaxID=2971236 RepID=UPI0002DEEFF6|nr:ribonuclease domain-containing protein [Xanthomonas sp. CFBP 8445]UYC12716.1 hypothetical protein NUG21_02945 [Xanthomonas sp. CFBP 8445]
MHRPISYALLAALLASTQAQAQKAPPACSALPTYVRDAARDMAYCITMANPIAACGSTQVDVQVFGNAEGRLPKAGKGQTYYEGKARRDPGGAAGTYRLVFLATDGKAKSTIAQRYYSADHYTTFCAVQ